MYNLDYTKLAVGDQVAVARTGSWVTQSEGVYTVVKADKMKIVVQREGAHWPRVFSVKKRREMSKGEYRSAYLESVEDCLARESLRVRERQVNLAWAAVEQAGRDNKVDDLRAALAGLVELGVYSNY